jgi:hypothetical protein
LLRRPISFICGNLPKPDRLDWSPLLDNVIVEGLSRPLAQKLLAARARAIARYKG